MSSGPFVHGTSCSWRDRKSGLTRVPKNQAFSQRSTTPAIGQGSNALLKGCLIPVTSVGRIVEYSFDAGCVEIQLDSLEMYDDEAASVLALRVYCWLTVARAASKCWTHEHERYFDQIRPRTMTTA